MAEAVPEILDAARAAVAGNDWREAYELLSKAHAAARIAAQADAEEIQVSRARMDDSGFAIDRSATRSLQLKGISEPVEALAIDWR